MWLVALAFIFLVAGVFLLWQSGRQRRAAGLPAGRVVYTDTENWTRVEKPLYHPGLGLTGKPDYIVHTDNGYIPVEVKSSAAPSVPYESHVFQLAAYCVLVESTTHQRPPYGLIRYRNRTIAVDFTPELEREIVDLLSEMRTFVHTSRVNRSHDEPGRCAHCGYRDVCDQRL